MVNKEAEKTWELSVECRFVIKQEDIDDIMVSALEGGINHWCGKAEVVEDDYLGEFASDQISRGGSLRLYDVNDGSFCLLTLERFLKGMRLLVELGYDEYNAVNCGEVDPGNIDAEIADRIIQLAVFGEIIYA